MRDKKARLLLVEDHPALQAALLQTLGVMFEVVAVHDSADAAVAWLDLNPDGWDLAVIDIFLKQGNGFRVLRKCAASRPWQQAVVLSNYTREPARSSALDLGAAAVFDKSFEMEAFIDWCSGHADLQEADDALCAEAARSGWPAHPH